MKIVTKIIMILSVLISFIINAPVFAANCSTAPDMLEEILKRGKIRIGWINSKPFQYRNIRGELEGALVNAGNMLGEELLKVEDIAEVKRIVRLLRAVEKQTLLLIGRYQHKYQIRSVSQQA